MLADLLRQTARLFPHLVDVEARCVLLPMLLEAAVQVGVPSPERAVLRALVVQLGVLVVALLVLGLLSSTLTGFVVAHESLRMPVTCQETFIPGLPPEMQKRLFEIS